MPYLPCVFFRAKCFAETPFHVIGRKHYVATFSKPYKREGNAINFAARQIEYDPDVWQLPGAAKIEDEG